MRLVAQRTVVHSGPLSGLEVHAFTLFEFVDGPEGYWPVERGVVYAVFDVASGLYTTHPTPSRGAAIGWVMAIEQMKREGEQAMVVAELEVLRAGLESERTLLRRHDAHIASENEERVIMEWMASNASLGRGGPAPP